MTFAKDRLGFDVQPDDGNESLAVCGYELGWEIKGPDGMKVIRREMSTKVPAASILSPEGRSCS
jgi:hypothetical protein